MKNIRAWWHKIRQSFPGRPSRRDRRSWRPQVELLERREVLSGSRVVLISLDGAKPDLIDQYLATGVLDPNSGLGYLRSHGIEAQQNLTVPPSLTAPSHIAIATGSNANNNDINSNTFHLLTSPFNANVSGFGAPIGGYDTHGPGESSEPTANPLWLNLRAAGKT
ncbi:MAG TPA: alkaline phosphatase family protein, partial [Gemmataceae bacterium]|nr:alkaline phosphatase family protein [Gemmataceae bacterium]